MNVLFRKLRADEIEVRVGSVTKMGCSLLLYKDARVDASILDETVGPFNWQKYYNRDNSNCVVSLWDEEKKQWIGKEDTGTESNTEKEKGLASDSFKRACFCWGLGRELYTAPFIFVKCDTVTEGNKYKLKNPYIKYDVKEIGYDESGRICHLVIVDDTGKVVFEQKATASNKTEETIDLPKCLNHIFSNCGNKLNGKKASDLVLNVKSEDAALKTLKAIADANVGEDSDVCSNLLSYIKDNKLKILVKEGMRA